MARLANPYRPIGIAVMFLALPMAVALYVIGAVGAAHLEGAEDSDARGAIAMAIAVVGALGAVASLIGHVRSWRLPSLVGSTVVAVCAAGVLVWSLTDRGLGVRDDTAFLVAAGAACCAGVIAAWTAMQPGDRLRG